MSAIPIRAAAPAARARVVGWISAAARASAPYLLFLLAVLVAWWALTASGTVRPFLLPAPADVANALTENVLRDARTWTAVAVTLREILVAFAIAAVAGVALGVAVGGGPLRRRAFEPLLGNLYAIPLVVLYPLLALWLGLGSASKIAFGALYAVFPVAIATAASVATVDSNLLAAARSMGARGFTLVRKVVVPGALPQILTGLQLGLVLTTLAVVGGEFIGGKEGLGYLLATSGQAFNTVQMYAYVVVTLAVAAALNGLMAAAALPLRRKLRIESEVPMP